MYLKIMSATFAVYNADNVLLYNPKTTLEGIAADFDVRLSWGPLPHTLFDIPWWKFWDENYWFNPIGNDPDESAIKSDGWSLGRWVTISSTDQKPLHPFDGKQPVRIQFAIGTWNQIYDFVDFPSLNNNTNFWYPIPVSDNSAVKEILVHIYVADNARDGSSAPLKGSSLVFELNYKTK
jgi:hypothetical protein